MEASRMKKIISIVLALAMVLPLSTPVFAAETEPGIDTFDVDYDFYWEYGEYRLANVQYKTDEELAQEGAALEIAADILVGAVDPTHFDPPETVLDFILPDASDFIEVFIQETYGFGKAAKIETYTKIDSRYRLNAITDERFLISQTYYMLIKLYVRNEDGTYEFYNDDTFKKRI